MVSPEGADVGLVDVVDNDRGNGDDLRRAGRHDRHQDEEEHGVFPDRSEQLLGNKRRSETFHDVFFREERCALCGRESKVGETHGGGQTERNCEPAEATCDEAPDALSKTLQSYLIQKKGLSDSRAIFGEDIT